MEKELLSPNLLKDGVEFVLGMTIYDSEGRDIETSAEQHEIRSTNFSSLLQGKKVGHTHYILSVKGKKADKSSLFNWGFDGLSLSSYYSSKKNAIRAKVKDLINNLEAQSNVLLATLKIEGYPSASIFNTTALIAEQSKAMKRELEKREG